jgi:transcriptional regulator with XRE-family HTH domain
MVVAIRGDRIRKILARKNMSQNCFAMRLGVSSGYMSQLMSGVRNPSPVLREKILSELKMNENGFDEIFELKG